MGAILSHGQPINAKRSKNSKLRTHDYESIRRAMLDSQSYSRPRLTFDSYDRFEFVKDHRKLVYDPTTFWALGPWLIERCSRDISIFSLESFAPRKFAITPIGATVFLIHITIIAETWDESKEFHVTIERVTRTRRGIDVVGVCSDFYKMDMDTTKKKSHHHHGAKSKSSRPVCAKESAVLDVISRHHAKEFAKFMNPL